jgi:uncharacterized protein (DUF433 family)
MNWSVSEAMFGGHPGFYIEHDVQKRPSHPFVDWETWPTESLLLSHKLQWMEDRQRRLELWTRGSEEETRTYAVPLIDLFHSAGHNYASVTVDPEVMAGAPCIKGTRIPVYMVLDAIEYYGSLEGVSKSYPNLTLQQIKDAVGFSKLVVECPLVNEAQIASS